MSPQRGEVTGLEPHSQGEVQPASRASNGSHAGLTLTVPLQDEARAFRADETGPVGPDGQLLGGSFWVLKLSLGQHLPRTASPHGGAHSAQPSVPLPAPPGASPALLGQASSSTRSCTSSLSPATRSPTWPWTSTTSCAAWCGWRPCSVSVPMGAPFPRGSRGVELGVHTG